MRQAEEFRFEEPQRIEYMDVSPKQVVGVSAALIPFLEHDDTNRAFDGLQYAATRPWPLVQPDAPIVGTGMEWQAAVDSGQVVVARKAGEAVRVVNTEIVIQEEDGNEHTYPLRKFNRSNQSTCIDQRPTIQKGDMVEAGTVPGRQLFHPERRAGAGAKRACGLHELGKAATTKTQFWSANGWSKTTSTRRYILRSTRSKPGRQSSARRRSRETFRTWVRTR